MQDLISALVQAAAGPRPGRDLLLRWLKVLLVAVVAGCSLVSAGFLCWWLRRAWQTASWDVYWVVALPAMPAVLMFWRLSPLVERWQQSKQLREGVNALRWAAAQGDDQLAPLAVQQPAPLLLGDWPASAAEFLITDPAADTTGIAAMFLALMGLIGVATAALGGWVLTLALGLRLAALGMFVILIGLALVLVAVFLFRRQRRLLRGQPLVADGWALRVPGGRAGATETVIPWHEVVSFFTVEIYEN
jgi:hypothetical protein